MGHPRISRGVPSETPRYPLETLLGIPYLVSWDPVVHIMGPHRTRPVDMDVVTGAYFRRRWGQTDPKTYQLMRWN